MKEIEHDLVSTNNSNQVQETVKEQLAVALYWFRHDRNSVSLQEVANWAGLGKETGHTFTQHIMSAILKPHFMNTYIGFLTADEKEIAKMWVEKHSCAAWRNGWCFFDGTLVLLGYCPAWFGKSYFD